MHTNSECEMLSELYMVMQRCLFRPMLLLSLDAPLLLIMRALVHALWGIWNIFYPMTGLSQSPWLCGLAQTYPIIKCPALAGIILKCWCQVWTFACCLATTILTYSTPNYHCYGEGLRPRV